MKLHPHRTAYAIANVMDERDRQDEKWGEQNHALPIWLAILEEEVGEFARAILHKTFDRGITEADAIRRCREEIIQVAAVAVAIVEFIDRWNPEPEPMRTECPICGLRIEGDFCLGGHRQWKSNRSTSK